MEKHEFRKSLCAIMVATSALLIAPAYAASDATEKSDSKAEPLRVCAGANEAPYSSTDGSGFENKIAEILGKTMGRPVEFAWEQKPAIYVVRDQLLKDNCDVVIGVAEQPNDGLVPLGTEATGHAWLHRACWPSWSRARECEAIATLASMGVGAKPFVSRIRPTGDTEPMPITPSASKHQTHQQEEKTDETRTEL